LRIIIGNEEGIVDNFKCDGSSKPGNRIRFGNLKKSVGDLDPCGRKYTIKRGWGLRNNKMKY